MKILKKISRFIFGPSDAEIIATGIRDGIKLRADIRSECRKNKKPMYEPSPELINLLNSK